MRGGHGEGGFRQRKLKQEKHNGNGELGTDVQILQMWAHEVIGRDWHVATKRRKEKETHLGNRQNGDAINRDQECRRRGLAGKALERGVMGAAGRALPVCQAVATTAGVQPSFKPKERTGVKCHTE